MNGSQLDHNRSTGTKRQFRDPQGRFIVTKRRARILVSLMCPGAAAIAAGALAFLGNDSRVVLTSLIYACLMVVRWGWSQHVISVRGVRRIMFDVGFAGGAISGGLLAFVYALYSVNTPTLMALLFVWSNLCGAYAFSSVSLRKCFCMPKPQGQLELAQSEPKGE